MDTLKHIKRLQMYTLLFLLAVACMFALLRPTTASAACGTLASGASLTPGQSIVSCNGAYTLAFQTDGNVVLYVGKVFTPEYALWSTKTNGEAATLFAMETDGNLVLYKTGSQTNDNALWASGSTPPTLKSGGGTFGKPGYLAVQDDGNLVVYATSDASVLWASNTVPRVLKEACEVNLPLDGYTCSHIAPPSASSLTMDDLQAILEEQGPNTPYVELYGASADGIGMDGLKIVETPIGSTYPYLGVFHQLVGSAFDTYAAYSTDLKTWHLLGTIRGGTSGQPDIRILPDKSVLVAYEMPSFFTSHITVKYYSSVDSFITNPSGATATIDLPMVPGNQNNGTPVFGTIIYNGNIYDSTIQITHHWRNQRSMDQVAIGYLTNFSSWTSSSDNAVNNKLAALGRLQVGDRDVFQVGDTVYEIVEANAHEPIGNSGWDTWRNYLINRGSSGLEVLDTRKLVPIIPGGAYSLGNPTASFLHLPDGRPALAFTHYLFYQGAANTPAGPHLYVYPLSTSYIAPTSTTPTPLPLRTGALTVTLTANGVTNPTVAEGDSHTLEWYSANASSCTLSYSLPGVSTIGTISLIPNAAGSGTSQAGGTRTITCIGTYGTTITKTITITVTPPITATSNYPRGYIESSTYATITGWAQDQDIPDSPIDVHFYIDKPPTDTDFSGYAGMVSAKDYRADLCNEIGSCNHAFLFTVPAKFKDGLAHTVYAYGMDEDGVGAHNLALIPYASTSNIFQYLAATTTTSTATLTAGKQSVVSGETVILVWESTNTSSCTGTNFYTGGKRFGLAGPYPKATTTYSITCAGNDDTSPTASVTVGVGAATTNIFYPRGYIESSNYATITGWAQDRDIPDSPIDVHIYIDKPPTATDFSGYVGMVSAKDYRSDLCTNAGSCNHAFTFTTPTKYQDGILHTVYAYGMDEDGVGAHNSALTPYSSTSNTFKYLAVTTSAPTITSISPSSGSGSVPITITGTGFNATQNLVFLGGIGGLCGLSYLTSTASGTSIACTLGLGGWSAGTYSLTVKNVTTGLTSTGVNFTVSAPRVLSITTVSPTS
ncbi:MAG TPA: IPT/TIG domain-containing protein, partial [Candidatus Paceibacterota bacterium]